MAAVLRPGAATRARARGRRRRHVAQLGDGTPPASWPAAGARMSRPANVGPGAGSRNSSLRERRPPCRAPPRMATAGASRPLSGPTRHAVLDLDREQRRSVPTPGSTTASTIASVGQVLRGANERERPARTSCGGTSWVRSTMREVGDEAEHHRLAHADELVGEPVVGEKGDETRHEARAGGRTPMQGSRGVAGARGAGTRSRPACTARRDRRRRRRRAPGRSARHGRREGRPP